MEKQLGTLTVRKRVFLISGSAAMSSLKPMWNASMALQIDPTCSCMYGLGNQITKALHHKIPRHGDLLVTQTKQ
jgi:hypothetical protein